MCPLARKAQPGGLPACLWLNGRMDRAGPEPLASPGPEQRAACLGKHAGMERRPVVVPRSSQAAAAVLGSAADKAPRRCCSVRCQSRRPASPRAQKPTLLGRMLSFISPAVRWLGGFPWGDLRFEKDWSVRGQKCVWGACLGLLALVLLPPRQRSCALWCSERKRFNQQPRRSPGHCWGCGAWRSCLPGS